MANVAGVAQLMDTVGATTNQPASATPGTSQSFAAVMQKANTDAGVPAAPVEPTNRQTAQAKNGTAQVVDKNEAQATTQTSGKDTPQSGANAIKIAAVSPPSSLRYTPANMLSAMLGGAGVAASNAANATPTPPSVVMPLSQASPAAGALPSVTPALGGAAGQASPSAIDSAPPAQAATPDVPSTNSAQPVFSASNAFAPSAKPSVKSEAVAAHAPVRYTAKQEAAQKVSSSADQPVLVAAVSPAPAPVAASSASLTITAPALAQTNVPSPPADAGVQAPIAHAANKVSSVGTVAAPTAPAVRSNPVVAAPITSPAIVALSTAAPKTPVSTTPVAPPADQPNASSVRQSLATQAVAPVETGAAANVVVEAERTEHSLLAGNKNPLTIPTATIPAASTDAPAPSVASATLAQVAATVAATAAVRPPATPSFPIQNSEPTPRGGAQTTAAHKPIAKLSFSPDALPVTTAASPKADVQPVVPVPQPDGKAVPHLPVQPAAAPTTVPPVDASAPLATAFPVAHTPVAITALGNASGPALAPSAAATVTSTTTTTDSLQHTTLSSTPTTLEVGVANGTHGWLKIRAELNASGTVDASLTGTNAAATGKLHNDLPALSSFLQDERVAVGSLNVSAPGAAASALHATVASTLEPVSSFTRSAAEGVGATGTAVASDAGASGGRAPQQQAAETSQQTAVAREDDGVTRVATPPATPLYGEGSELGGNGALSQGGYGGGSWLNVRV